MFSSRNDDNHNYNITDMSTLLPFDTTLFTHTSLSSPSTATITTTSQYSHLDSTTLLSRISRYSTQLLLHPAYTLFIFSIFVLQLTLLIWFVNKV